MCTKSTTNRVEFVPLVGEQVYQGGYAEHGERDLEYNQFQSMKSWRRIVIFDELELERKFFDAYSIDRRVGSPCICKAINLVSISIFSSKEESRAVLNLPEGTAFLAALAAAPVCSETALADSAAALTDAFGFAFLEGLIGPTSLVLRAALSWRSATFCEGVRFVVLRRRFLAFGLSP